MLTVAFVLLLVTAAPARPVLGEISAPFGRIGNVVDEPPRGGIGDSDKVLTPKWEGCEPQSIYLMRFMGGVGRALEQLQQSLDRAPGGEKKLFGRKGVLGEVMKQLGASRFTAQVGCSPLPLAQGYQLDLLTAPKKWCDGPEELAEGEFWFFMAKRPTAVVAVHRGSIDVCKPRLSMVLFDGSGAARLRFHADWAGAVSASLVGERCQTVDYTLDLARQVFVPTWKSCKR